MPKTNPFVSDVLDRLAVLGEVTARAMFGGYGVYYQGVMFGLIANSVFYLKTDDENRSAFEAAGSEPFRYRRKGQKKATVMSYWEVPPEVLENPERLRQWSQAAHAAAQRRR